MTTDPTIHTDILLVVPAEGSRSLAHVAPGSVIVGVSKAEGTLCYYEGGVHNPRMTWDQMLQIATGRLHERYPTTALVFAPTADVTVVGRVIRDDLLGNRWMLSSIDDETALAAWRPQGGYFTGRTSDMVRAAAGLRAHKGLTPSEYGTYKAALGAGRSLDEACEALLQAK